MVKTFLLSVVVGACTLAFGQRAKAPVEDLSPYRPKPTPDTAWQRPQRPPVPLVPATLTVNAVVDAVLDSIDRINQLRKFVDGYTIQVYAGQSREAANQAKKTMADEAADLRAELQYLAPKFRVKVGAYYTRLEAQKDLVRLRKMFPNAILVPEKMLIRN